MPGTLIRAACIMLAALACNADAIAAERTATSVVHISDFSYELIDLNLNDGITPALEINGEVATSRAGYRPPRQPAEVNTLDGYGTVSFANAFGATTTSMSPTTATTSATIGGQAQDTQAQAFFGYTWRLLSFTLTPSTGLLLKAVGSISGQASGGSTSHWGQVGMQGIVSDGTDSGASEFNKFFTAYDKDVTHQLYGYLHTNELAGTGYFRLTSETNANLWDTDIPPVPEPGSWAMMLAGLAVTGALARRRRRQG